MSLVGLLTRLLGPGRVTSFDRQTVLLLRLGVPVAGSGWLEPKRNTDDVHALDLEIATFTVKNTHTHTGTNVLDKGTNTSGYTEGISSV